MVLRRFDGTADGEEEPGRVGLMGVCWLVEQLIAAKDRGERADEMWGLRPDSMEGGCKVKYKEKGRLIKTHNPKLILVFV